jgi:hypothetical protein
MEANVMTKRIVSGIFILTALGALGVILAGALTSGEQLIVRFLTAVIVAALGLYVISDLRLQADDDAAGMRMGPSWRGGIDAPPNSTAAFMATVTRKGESPGGNPPVDDDLDVPAEDDRFDPHEEGVGATSSSTSEQHESAVVEDAGSLEGSPVPSILGAAPVTVRAADLPVLTGRKPATITELFARQGDKDEGDAQVWPTFQPVDQPIDRDEHAESSFDDATRSTNGSGGQADREGWSGARWADLEDGAAASVDETWNERADDETGNERADDGDTDDAVAVAEFEYSGEIDSPAYQWPAAPEEPEDLHPAEVEDPDRPSRDDLRPVTPFTWDGMDDDGDDAVIGRSPADRSTAGIDEHPTAAIPASPHGPAFAEIGDEPSLGEEPVVWTRQDEHGVSIPVAAMVDDTPAGEVTPARPVDDAEADVTAGAEDGEPSVTQGTDRDLDIDQEPVADRDSETDLVTGLDCETDAVADLDSETGLVADLDSDPDLDRVLDLDGDTGGGFDVEPEPSVNGTHRPLPSPFLDHSSLSAAEYADAPLAPIIDLRDVATTTGSGIESAIRSGEVEVISALIEQGMLSTAGPISDRDVRTMVYVAFTSNELRKLLLAGGSPEGPNPGIDLGPVELFDKGIEAPKTLYPGLPVQTEARTQLG